MGELEEKVFLVPVRVLNSETSDPMGVRVWDWKHYAIKAAQKINAVIYIMSKVRHNNTIEMAGGKVKESSLDRYPCANEYGTLVS